MSIGTEEEADKLADYLDRYFAKLGRKVHVVVNYDNFDLAPPARDTFFAMVKHNEDCYFLSSTRYSTDAFFRHQLKEDFTEAGARSAHLPQLRRGAQEPARKRPVEGPGPKRRRPDGPIEEDRA
jgi:hypothetical protein